MGDVVNNDGRASKASESRMTKRVDGPRSIHGMQQEERRESR